VCSVVICRSSRSAAKGLDTATKASWSWWPRQTLLSDPNRSGEQPQNWRSPRRLRPKCESQHHASPCIPHKSESFEFSDQFVRPDGAHLRSMARSKKTLATVTAIAAGTPIHHDRPMCRHASRIIRAIAHPSSDTNTVHPGSLPASVLWLMFSVVTEANRRPSTHGPPSAEWQSDRWPSPSEVATPTAGAWKRFRSVRHARITAPQAHGSVAAHRQPRCSLCVALTLAASAPAVQADDLLQIYQQALTSDPLVCKRKRNVTLCW